MPGTDGLTATRSIAADDGLAEVRIVILTTFELDEYVFEAIRAGASGFIVKHTKPAELLQAVRAVAAGDALLSPSVTRRLIREFAARTREAPRSPTLDALTEREREVMALVAEGLTNDGSSLVSAQVPGRRRRPPGVGLDLAQRWPGRPGHRSRGTGPGP
jgi:DNA-binding NarL/FixJ family response regulator